MGDSLTGRKAPDFSLEGSDGKTHSLKDYSGKRVILYFYPRDNTPGCTREACGFRDEYAALRKTGVVMFGVSKDSLASHEKFITDHGLPFVLLSDPDHEVMEKYGAWGMKKSYGKETEGTLRSTVVIGEDGKVVKHWTSIKKAEEHPAQVLEFLQANE